MNIREEIRIVYHMHDCPNCKRMFSCAVNKCNTTRTLWCMCKGVSKKVYLHWQQIRQTGHSEIIIRSKNKSAIPLRAVK